jgi:hypothetical protein
VRADLRATDDPGAIDPRHGPGWNVKTRPRGRDGPYITLREMIRRAAAKQADLRHHSVLDAFPVVVALRGVSQSRR